MRKKKRPLAINHSIVSHGEAFVTPQMLMEC